MSRSSFSWLLVKNLPWTAEKRDVVSYFSKFGRMGPIKLPYNPETGMILGYALVAFHDSKSCDKVLSQPLHLIENEKILVTLDQSSATNSATTNEDEN